MALRHLNKIKKLTVFLFFMFLFLTLSACSKGKKKFCPDTILDDRFSDYIASGPYSIKKAMQEYNKDMSIASTKKSNIYNNSFFKDANISGCIYSFTSSEEDWNRLSGAEGYVLVRDDVVVNAIITMKN